MTKLLPYILFDKYIYILALEMASPGNRHCANFIGALSFPIKLTTRCYDRPAVALLSPNLVTPTQPFETK